MSIKCSDLGPPDAKIVIVTDAPSVRDEQNGVLFSDSTGKLFKQMLSHSGLDFNSCYVTSVMFVRPPSNNFKYMYNGNMPSKQLEELWQNLRNKLDNIRPELIIVVGGEALRAVCNKVNINAYRGTWLKYKSAKVMPVYHPSYVMKVYSEHVVFEMDIAKAITRKPAIVPPIILKPTLSQVIKWIDSARKSGTYVAFDIESVKDTVRCIGFAVDKPQKSAIVIPFISFNTSNITVSANKTIVRPTDACGTASSYWSVEDEVSVLNVIDEFFRDKNVRFVGHNSISFDEPFLKREFGLTIENHFMDTMNAWHTLYSELPKGLDFLCSVFTDYHNYWTDKLAEDDISEWTYNAMDCIVTLECAIAINKELLQAINEYSHGIPKYKCLSDTYFSHVMPLSKALSAAQEHGVLVDTKVRDELKRTYDEKIKITQKEINEIVKQNVNCNSPKQMQELLYSKFRYPVIMEKNAKGENAPSTSETAILTLRKRFPNDKLLELILRYRKDTKLVSTFLTVQTDANNRMHTSYNVSGTKSFRISSSKDLFGNGMNLQNIPAGKKPGVENVRDLFIASPGCKLIKSDLSQAETLVVARILCRYGDMTLFEKYQNPDFDIHKWAASIIYNKDERDITKEERNVGKIANHAGNYCSGPGVIVNTALKWGIDDMSYDIAKVIADTRHKQLPGLHKWWKDVEDTVSCSRVLYTCMGRRRLFFGRTSDNSVIRDAVSFEPQSTVGDVCNEIFREMYRMRDEYKGMPVLQVHDEVVIECPDDYVDTCVSLLRQVAQIPLHLNKSLPPLIIPLEIKVGDNWKNTTIVQ